MSGNTDPLTNKVALVTGAAKRIGAASAKALHASGANVVIHYHQSQEAANRLSAELNQIRSNSAIAIAAKLGTRERAEWCVEKAIKQWNRLDVVVNNASSFFATPIGNIADADVSDLVSSNVSAPLFITQAAHAELEKRQGSVINMVDVHGLRPYENHSVYCAAKAALVMLTHSLARELAPNIRVNGIAPGAILWPENGSVDQEEQALKIATIPLGRQGTADDIARLVVYLASDASSYVTGEIIKVDGGKSI